MPVPKQHHTKSKRNRRRSHHALKQAGLTICQKCGQEIMPHRLCLNCGAYAGREIIDVLAKLDKKERKKREKEIAAAEHEHEREHGHGHEKEVKPLTMEELSKK